VDERLIFHFENPPLMVEIARGFKFQYPGRLPWMIVTRPPESEQERAEFSQRITQLAIERFRLEARHALN
jgi:hypothetical protein